MSRGGGARSGAALARQLATARRDRADLRQRLAEQRQTSHWLRRLIMQIYNGKLTPSLAYRRVFKGERE